MPKFNRERAKKELGWSDAQIEQYLASPQAQTDSAAASTPAPVEASVAPSAGMIDPMGTAAGMGASALDAIGGPRTVLGLGGVGALGYGAKKVMERMRNAAPAAATTTAAPAAPAPAPAAAPVAPAEAKLPSGWQRLSEDDFARHAKDLKDFKVGDPIQLKELQDIRKAASGRAPASKPATPKSRSTAVAAKAEKPVAKSTQPAVKRARAANPKLSVVEGEPPPGLTNRVTTLYGREGGPVKGLLPANAEGASNPELMRRAAQLSPGSRARAIAMESLGMTEEQLAAQLASKGMGSAVMREAAGPAMLAAPAAFAIIRHLLSGGDIRDLGDPENIQRLLESTGIAMPPSPPEPAYGEPGYRGPI